MEEKEGKSCKCGDLIFPFSAKERRRRGREERENSLARFLSLIFIFIFCWNSFFLFLKGLIFNFSKLSDVEFTCGRGRGGKGRGSISLVGEPIARGGGHGADNVSLF